MPSATPSTPQARLASVTHAPHSSRARRFTGILLAGSCAVSLAVAPAQAQSSAPGAASSAPAATQPADAEATPQQVGSLPTEVTTSIPALGSLEPAAGAQPTDMIWALLGQFHIRTSGPEVAQSTGGSANTPLDTSLRSVSTGSVEAGALSAASTSSNSALTRPVLTGAILAFLLGALAATGVHQFIR